MCACVCAHINTHTFLKISPEDMLIDFREEKGRREREREKKKSM